MTGSILTESTFKLIPLGKSGKFAIVDEEDYEWLMQWKWKLNINGYAARTTRSKSKFACVYMHRLINQTPEGFDTDHINRNRLDNRRSNLKTATKKENCRNKGIAKTNTSGYIGVTWDKNKWVAQSSIDKKRVYIGRFDTPEEASNAYQAFISAATKDRELMAFSNKISNRKELGVHWDKKSQKWIAQKWKGGKSIYIGAFKDKKDAIAARKNWELSHQSTAKP